MKLEPGTHYLGPGRDRYRCHLTFKDDVIIIKSGYHPELISEIKAMKTARWHPEDKTWTVANDPRNVFQLAFMAGQRPYKAYDAPYVDFKSERELFKHQIEMAQHGLTRHYCIFACEMGTGKTLAAIEIMERANGECWYVGPRSGVVAVNRELLKWNSKVRPRMMTYEDLVRTIRAWPAGKVPPKCVVFDESSKIKTPTAQRSQAAFHLANSIREEWGSEGYVILMSGTPAPRTPDDWWHQCEVACPGYLKEGDINKFKRRLCIIEDRQSPAGGSYPAIVTWLDNESKCTFCGEMEDHENHKKETLAIDPAAKVHGYVKSVNEIAKLHRRMSGLVLVRFKKDCLELPEIVYDPVQITPTVDMLRTMKSIANTSGRAIEALTLIRELADGFQYIETEVGKQVCQNCKGEGKITCKVPKVERADPNDPASIGEKPTSEIKAEDFEVKEVMCDICGGTCKTAIYKRDTKLVGSPKDQQLVEDLSDQEDIGRIIVWAGFQASVDRVIQICKKEGWETLTVDGRGYRTSSTTISVDTALAAMDRSDKNFQKNMEDIPRIAFVGNPEAGGMALTLTAASLMIYYSNSFSGTARMQSEARGHRPGMDLNRGLTIRDYILLPTDKLVIENLKQKKDLQSISMGEIIEAVNKGVGQ